MKASATIKSKSQPMLLKLLNIEGIFHKEAAFLKAFPVSAL